MAMLGFDLIECWKKSKGNIIYCNTINLNDDINLRISQWECITQKSGNSSCGYYCIYYCYMLHLIFKQLSQIKTSNSKIIQENVIQLQKNLRSIDCYDTFKSNIMDELTKICVERTQNNLKKNKNFKPLYPWTKKDINYGVLERVYLQKLQNTHHIKRNNKLDDIKNNNNNEYYPSKYNDNNAVVAKKYHFRYLFDCINLLEFSSSSLKTNNPPITTLKYVEYFFDLFKKNKDNYKVFLIGSAIHYVIIAVYKDKINPNIIDVIYIDPQNTNIIGKSEDYILNDIIPKMAFKSWIQMGWKLKDMQKLAFDSYSGIQFSINMIKDTIIKMYKNNENIQYYLINKVLNINLLNGFIGSFYGSCIEPFLLEINTKNTNNIESKTNESNNDIKAVDDTDLDFQKTWKFNKNEFKLSLQFIMKMLHKDIESKNKLHFQSLSNFVYIWSNDYYPSAVIDVNVSQLISDMYHDNIDTIFVDTLLLWIKLINILLSQKNRKLMSIKNNKFWNRFAKSIRNLNIICEQKRQVSKY